MEDFDDISNVDLISTEIKDSYEAKRQERKCSRLALAETAYEPPLNDASSSTLSSGSEFEAKVILLHLCAVPSLDICSQLHCSIVDVMEVLESAAATKAIRDNAEMLDKEFKAMHKLANEAIRDCLDSGDEKIRMSAADKWLKASGKYTQTLVVENVTAEDVAKHIKAEALAAEAARLIEGEEE